MYNKSEHEAVAKARNNGDLGVLAVCLAVIGAEVVGMLVVGFLVALAAEVAGASEGGFFEFIGNVVVYGLILIAVTVLALVSIRMLRQANLGNALHVEYSDYAWLRDWANQVAADLRMPRVEIFITQDPYINAYAVGFMRPYNIVLNSGTIRYLTDDEIKAVTLHEMAHVKYYHTLIGAYLTSVRALPFVGPLNEWILNFWTRRNELTADRLALCYLKDPALVKEALIKVHVGPDVAKSFNDVARQWQAHTTNNAFNLFTQTFSSHPFLVRRLQHIDRYSYLIQPQVVAPQPVAVASTEQS